LQTKQSTPFLTTALIDHHVNSAPGRIRTCDARFRKPSLSPLSYGGSLCAGPMQCQLAARRANRLPTSRADCPRNGGSEQATHVIVCDRLKASGVARLDSKQPTVATARPAGTAARPLGHVGVLRGGPEQPPRPVGRRSVRWDRSVLFGLDRSRQTLLRQADARSAHPSLRSLVHRRTGATSWHCPSRCERRERRVPVRCSTIATACQRGSTNRCSIRPRLGEVDGIAVMRHDARRGLAGATANSPRLLRCSSTLQGRGRLRVPRHAWVSLPRHVHSRRSG
jgi:hypothetical protein